MSRACGGAQAEERGDQLDAEHVAGRRRRQRRAGAAAERLHTARASSRNTSAITQVPMAK